MTPLVRLVSTIIAAVAFLIALSHLLQAESGPGDGFTAGIIFALALTLVYETRSVRHLSDWLENPHFERFLFMGLGLVMMGALLPLFFQSNLLGPVEYTLELPVLGALKLTQTKLFEIGLALAVFSGSMIAISSLRGKEEQAGEEPDESEAAEEVANRKAIEDRKAVEDEEA